MLSFWEGLFSGSPPQKFNVDTKNGKKKSRNPPFPRPIILGQVSFRGGRGSLLGSDFRFFFWGISFEWRYALPVKTIFASTEEWGLWKGWCGCQLVEQLRICANFWWTPMRSNLSLIYFVELPFAVCMFNMFLLFCVVPSWFHLFGVFFVWVLFVCCFLVWLFGWFVCWFGFVVCLFVILIVCLFLLFFLCLFVWLVVVLFVLVVFLF